MLEHSVDHLVLLSPSVARGMAVLTDLFGVAPAAGQGVHKDEGTEHLLLGLGGDQYIEVLCAVDSPPADSPGAAIAQLRHPVFSTFGIRTGDMQASIKQIAPTRLAVDPVYSLSHQVNQEQCWHWKLGVVGGHDFDHQIPFLIDWGNTPHLAQRVPVGGRGLKLVAYSPNVEGLLQCYSALNVNVSVMYSEKPHLEAVITTSSGRLGDGVVTLRTGQSIKV